LTKKPPVETRLFYGWVMVFFAGFTLFFSGPGQTFSVSVFIDSYINEFGWSRSLVSGMYSMGTLAAGVVMSVVGGLFDRYGHRRMSTLVAAFFGAACMYMSFIGSLPMLFVGFFLIRLLGQGSMSLIGTTLVPQWFIRNRGRALSIFSLFGALGLATIPSINTWIIQNISWQMGWRVWALLLWFFVAPLVYFFVRTRPEDVGLLPDGDVIDSASEEVQFVEEVSWTLSEAVKTRAFWIIVYLIIVPSAINTGCMFHQISILGEAGLSPQQAALINGVISVVRIPFILIAGQLADRIQLRFLLTVSQFLIVLMLITLYFANSVPLVIMYGVFFGLQMALQSLAIGAIWPDYYGRRYLGTIRGVTMMVGVIVSALGPLPFGYAYDIFGGYGEIIMVSLILPLLGTVLALLARKPVKKE